jgi:3-oxoadipate enol-lactonase
MPHAQIGDVSLYYEVHGTGAPVVLIPGLGADTRLFFNITKQLAAQRQVVVLDPRGGGKSDKPAGPYSIEQMADDVAGLLLSIGIHKADVLGYSMGGKIALQLAATRPERVDHLVLAATAARPLVTRRFTRRWLMFDVISRIPLLRIADSQPSHAFEAQRRASATFDGRALLAKVRAPTLVVRARRDYIVAAVDTAELCGIVGSTLVELRGGHLTLVMLHWKELAVAVASFLDTP